MDDAWLDARQRKLLKLAGADPQGAAPGIALYRALTAAWRGDEPTTLAALGEAAAAVGGFR